MSLVKKIPINFQLGKGEPAVIFVKAEWFPHCQAAKPVMDKVSRILGSVIPVYVVDSDDNANLISAWNVKSFPTVYFSTGKGESFMFQGKRTPDTVASWVCKLSNLCPVRQEYYGSYSKAGR